MRRRVQERAEAQGRARLSVARYAAGVVIRSAGYKARTENVGKLRAVRPLVPTDDWKVCDRQSRVPFHFSVTAHDPFVPKAFAIFRASMTACAHSSGRSCGRLWPEPLNMRCSCGPVNFFA